MQVHTKFVPDLDVLPRIDTAYVERHHRHLAAAAAAWSGSTSCSSTGGTTPCRAGSKPRGWLDELRQRGQDRPHRRHQFRHRAHAGDASRRACRCRRCRCSIRCSTAGRRRRWSTLRRRNGVAIFCYGTVAGGFLGERWLGAARAAGAAREPLADQIQADHRRFRRLGPVPGLAARAATPSPTAMAPTSPPWPALRCWRGPAWPPSSSARATAPISQRTCAIARLRARRADDMRGDRRRARPRARRSTAMSTRWSATARAATARS